MKEFHRSFICRSTETGKKGHKSKHYSNKNDVCKCYAPFLKLHYYDCPVARKPCPIHGSPYRHCIKDEKAEKKENMIISFHPSSKTDRLFRPVKNLLTHCNPETKIHLEYYSPNNSTSKDDTKPSQMETNSEELKKNLGSKDFVEKTKSFMTDKTNRMKRLKQCFHSPCNSIVARTKSQFTLRDKINEKFLPEELPDNKYYNGKFKWTSSNKLDSSDWEKSSDYKIESDFVTVTKQSEDKVIDHKIFEIKHKKGFGDLRFTKLPRQSSLVYSSYDIENSKKVSNDPGVQDDPSSNQKNLEKYSNNKEMVKKNDNKEETSSSGKSQSSSCGSVYFTSHIFRLGMEESASEGSEYAEGVLKERPEDVKDEIKAGDKAVNTVNTSVQTETPITEKKVLEASPTLESSPSDKSFESDKKLTSLKQEKAVGSGDISARNKNTYSPEKPQSRASKISASKSEEYFSMNNSQNTSKSVNKSTQISPPNSRATDKYDLSEDEFYDKKKTKRPDSLLVSNETRKHVSDKKFSSAYVQTETTRERGVPLVYDVFVKVADKITQTKTITKRDVQVETMALKKNKSQMTYSTKEKLIQTSFTLSDSQSQSNEGESADLDSHVNCVVTSYISPLYSQNVSESQWKKSHSDGDLFDVQAGNSANENVMPLHHICYCGNSETSTSEIDFSSSEKICQSEKSNIKMMGQNVNYSESSEIRREEIFIRNQATLLDLTELTRMLHQFLNKANKEAFIVCECDKREDSKTNQEIKVDSSKTTKKPKINVVDAEVQTTFKVIVDPSEEEKAKGSWCKVKTRQSVSSQDDEDTILVCTICRRKMSTFAAEADAIIDNLEKNTSLKKEVMFASVGTITDSSGVSVITAKRSIGVSVSEDSRVDGSVSKQKLNVAENIYTNDMNNAFAPKKPLNENKSFFNCDSNNKNTKVGEKKSIKSAEKSDGWKPIDRSMLSETYEKYTISKSIDTCKFKPVPGKSSIPTPACNSKKSINFKDREPATTKMNCQPNFMPGMSKKTSKSHKDSTPSFDGRTICICDTSDAKPAKSPVRIEPSTSNRIPRYCSQKPPLPTKPKNGASKSQARPGASSPEAKTSKNSCQETPPKKPGQKNTILYPAIIRPMWYMDFKKNFQIIKSIQSLQECNSSILKQKRCCEREDDSPGGKKIKGKDKGSGESFEFEKSVIAPSGKTIIDMRDKTGFVWIPSSALQISKEDTHSICFLRGSQSESKVTKSYSQNPTLFRGLNKRTPTNVLSVKRCRLKPVQVNEKHPFRKLFECRLCKSLNFLKNDQKETLVNEKRSDGAFGYEPYKAKDENPLSDEENPNSVNKTTSDQMRKEYFEGYSFPSDPGVSTDTSESSDSIDDNREEETGRIELGFLSLLGEQESDSFSDTAVASQSFDTFWFGSDIGKK